MTVWLVIWTVCPIVFVWHRCPFHAPTVKPVGGRISRAYLHREESNSWPLPLPITALAVTFVILQRLPIPMLSLSSSISESLFFLTRIKFEANIGQTPVKIICCVSGWHLCASGRVSDWNANLRQLQPVVQQVIGITGKQSQSDMQLGVDHFSEQATNPTMCGSYPRPANASCLFPESSGQSAKCDIGVAVVEMARTSPHQLHWRCCQTDKS